MVESFDDFMHIGIDRMANIKKKKEARILLDRTRQDVGLPNWVIFLVMLIAVVMLYRALYR